MASLRPVRRGFTIARQSARKPESRSLRIRFRTVPSSAPTDFAIEPYDGRRFQGSGRAERSLTTDRRIRDRKSTRLNSSHSQISYAVFCLKKKKKNTHKKHNIVLFQST